MPTKPLDRMTLLNVTMFVEAFLLLAATVWSQLTNIPLIKAFGFNYKLLLIGAGVGIIMALGGFAMYSATRSWSIFGQLREVIERHLIPMLGALRPIDLVVMAVLSGTCEEIFFRGVIQPQFGLPVTALAFALLHDPSLRNLSYSIVVFAYGLILGALYIYTGNNLWAPIMAHTVHNLISLWLLRYHMKPPASAVQS